MRHRATALAAVALAVAAVLAIGATAASATPPPAPTFADACGGSNNFDPAVCERLEYLAASGVTVYTSSDDSHRLDLVWWAVWAQVGLTFLALIAPAWWRAWGYETKLGRS